MAEFSKQLTVKGKRVVVETHEMAGETPSLLLRARLGEIEIEKTITIGPDKSVELRQEQHGYNAAKLQAALDAERQALAEQAELRLRMKDLLKQVS